VAVPDNMRDAFGITVERFVVSSCAANIMLVATVVMRCLQLAGCQVKQQ
jgi:hypothetical protein